MYQLSSKWEINIHYILKLGKDHYLKTDSHMHDGVKLPGQLLHPHILSFQLITRKRTWEEVSS